MKSHSSKSSSFQKPFKGAINSVETRSGTHSSASRRQAESNVRGAATPGRQWTFLTNHSHVLILLARHPAIVLREVAAQVGITERAVQRIIADLEAGNFIEREKAGRQNRYRIMHTQSLRHPIESHRSIGDLLILLNEAHQ